MRVLQKVEVVGFTASLNMRLILVNGLAVNLRGGKNAVGRKQTVGGYDTQANVTGGQHEKVGSGSVRTGAFRVIPPYDVNPHELPLSIG